MSPKPTGDVFNKFTQYNVFIKRVAGGGKIVALVEAEVKGASDYIYHYSTASAEKKVLVYEITSPGMMSSYWMNRAMLGKMGYVGIISGYGANAFFRMGGDLRKYIRDYGKLAKRRGLFSRFFRWLFR